MAQHAREDRAAEMPRRYRGTVVLAGLLSLTLSIASILVVSGERLVGTVRNTLAGTVPSVDDAHALTIAIIVATAVPTAATVAADATIRVLRVNLYLRRLHTHATDYLHRYAPLHEMGIDPAIVPFDATGTPLRSTRTASLTRRLRSAEPTLLLGEIGSGKTTALYGLAESLTRRRMLLARVFSRRRLPVLLSLGELELRDDGVSPAIDLITAQVRRFGSAGLALRTVPLLRRGRITLLCDDIDAASPAARSAMCRRLANLIEAYPRTPVMATCRLEIYRDGLQTERSLRGFRRVVLSGLAAPQIASGLRSLPASGRMTRPRRRADERELQRVALDVTASSPAGLQAIRELVASGELVPGRGNALLQFARSRLKHTRTVGSDLADAEILLAALAAGLRMDEHRAVRVGSELSLATTACELASTAAQAPSLPVEDGAVEAALAAAIDAGILVRSPDGGYVRFANGYIEAVFAAEWLHLTDDGFGALRADLLRPEWLLPLALWATLTPQPGDLAKRILRLADTPDAVALRAGLPSPSDAVAHVLAAALVVLAEGASAALAEDHSGAPTRDDAASLAAEHVRDVLDLAHVYRAQPEGASRLAAHLRAVADRVGPEFMDALGRLAADTRLSRLARSQLIALLGLVSDDAAVDTLMRLLKDMDPMVRQSVNQAFIHAGPLGLDRLRHVALTQGGRLRERASEVMALLGDDAIGTAMEMLSNPDAAMRESAAATLGELRAVQAQDVLVEKLADTTMEVRIAAVHALARIGTTGARDAIRNLLPHSDAPLRAACVEAFGTLRAEDAVRDICDLLADTSPNVRSAAAQALGRIGDEAAVPALEARRGDEDIWVRQAVETALRRLGRIPAQHGILSRTPA